MFKCPKCNYKVDRINKRIFKKHIRDCISDNDEKYDIIFKENLWDTLETHPGYGSQKNTTNVIRKYLPKIIKKYNIKTLLDCPCGDFNYMRFIIDKLPIKYFGVDICKNLIDINKKNYLHNFSYMNCIEDKITSYDLIIMKDLLNHLSFNEIIKVFKNIKNSGSKYLLLNTDNIKKNKLNFKAYAPLWLKINWELYPYSFKIIEKYLSDGRDCSYILISINDLNINFKNYDLIKMEKKYIILTINIGNRPYIKYTGKFMENYAKKVNADFKIITSYKLKKKYKIGRSWNNNNYVYLLKCKLIYDYLQKYDKILLLDDTVLINPNTPDLFEMIENGIAGFNEGKQEFRTSMVYDKKFIKKKINYEIDINKYINAGVLIFTKEYDYICDNENIDKYNLLFQSRWPEQAYLNYMIQKTNANLICLDEKFNKMRVTKHNKEPFHKKTIKIETDYVLNSGNLMWHLTSYYGEARLNYIKQIYKILKKEYGKNWEKITSN